MSGKKKLAQFAELATFSNVIQVPFSEISEIQKFKFKGVWAKKVFLNDKPIILELGCGKGEYTIGLAKKYPDFNFIGIDIKGARIWRGAKTAIEDQIPNVRFLRTRIEFLDTFFDQNEIKEIWVTFPDPQPRLSREKKRLTSPKFLEMYRSILDKQGIVHLKTDASALYEYSVETAKNMSFEILISSNKLYEDLPSLSLTEIEKEILNIPTFYEKMFKEKGHEICYLKFSINHD